MKSALAQINHIRAEKLIEKNIIQYLESFAGELNDSVTRETISDQLTKYLSGFAFDHTKVVCNEANNPPGVVDGGYIVADVFTSADGIERNLSFWGGPCDARDGWLKVNCDSFDLTPTQGVLFEDFSNEVEEDVEEAAPIIYKFKLPATEGRRIFYCDVPVTTDNEIAGEIITHIDELPGSQQVAAGINRGIPLTEVKRVELVMDAGCYYAPYIPQMTLNIDLSPYIIKLNMHYDLPKHPEMPQALASTLGY